MKKVLMLGGSMQQIPAIKAAKAKGIKISCDLNYRGKLWTRSAPCWSASPVIWWSLCGRPMSAKGANFFRGQIFPDFRILGGGFYPSRSVVENMCLIGHPPAPISGEKFFCIQKPVWCGLRSHGMTFLFRGTVFMAVCGRISTVPSNGYKRQKRREFYM